MEANLDRYQAELADETAAASNLWGKIRREEEEQRYAARIAEPERLKSETLRAIADYRAGLAALDP